MNWPIAISLRTRNEETLTQYPCYIWLRDALELASSRDDVLLAMWTTLNNSTNSDVVEIIKLVRERYTIDE